MRLFRYGLKQIPYDYTGEVTNRFKGLDQTECLKNYGRRFVTLYRRQWPKPSQRNRNARKQSGCLRGLYKQLRKEEKRKAREKGKDTPNWMQSSRKQLGERRKKVKVKVTLSCPTLWDLMDYTVHGILQARILELVAFPFCRGSSWPRSQTRDQICISGRLFLPAELSGKPDR